MGKENLFRVVKIKSEEEDKYIIVCGKSRASKKEFETTEEAWDYIDAMRLDWDVIVTVIGEMTEVINKIKNKK